MTREEAIKLLEAYSDKWGNMPAYENMTIEYTDELDNALYMAITALRAQQEAEGSTPLTLEIQNRDLRNIVLKRLRGVEYQYTQRHSLMAENVADYICQGIENFLTEKERERPLTLDELREMDGEPVWCVCGDVSEWMIAGKEDCEGKRYIFDFSYYGDTWLAYRRNPEEV